ncbi:MAG: hypothetical protein NTZ93_02060 [Candidatus Beckwithbacteria bacterium]|nr:hypothetical protein [Candidatus Beckwithbacteria bacterium]
MKELSLINTLSVLALIASQTGCKASPTTPEATPTNTFPTLTIETPTFAPFDTPTSISIATEAATTQEPTKSWEPLTEEKRKSLLANPDFFTKPLDSSGRVILTSQFDDTQYEGIVGTENRSVRCGEAVIATILKMFTYFETGKVPDITIANVYNKLKEKMPPIQADGPMSDYQLWSAIDYLGQENGLSISTRPLIPYCDDHCSSAAHESDWPNYFVTTLSKSGVLLLRAWAHDQPHFFIISAGNERGALIIDSIGSGDQGSVGVQNLGGYIEKIPETEMPNAEGRLAPYELAGQKVILSMTLIFRASK